MAEVAGSNPAEPIVVFNSEPIDIKKYGLGIWLLLGGAVNTIVPLSQRVL
jgi:hypothetical protein